MQHKDIRWIQRFNNFTKAFLQLSMAYELSQKRELSELEKQGLIQAFEFTHELAWSTLKDYIEHKGGQSLVGSKDTTREAFQKGLLLQGDVWMEMIKSRNLTSHTYNAETSKQITKNIIELYVPSFSAFSEKMKSLLHDS